MAVVGGGDDFGVVVDVGWELDNFGFWLVGFWLVGFWLVGLIVGLTGVFGRIVGSPVGTFPLLFGIAFSLGAVFWFLVGEPRILEHVDTFSDLLFDTVG